jgi:hypothetical protein
MRKFLFLLTILLYAFTIKSISQDTLPRITVKNISNQIVISWKNNFGAKISTINIQRSVDSLKNFTTIGSVLNPLNKENGYVDSKVINPNMFYRVFVAFEGGTYLFSKSHRPVIDIPKKIEVATNIDTVRQKPPENQEVPDFTTTPPTQLNQTEQDLLHVDENLLPPSKKPVKVKPPTGFVPSKFIPTGIITLLLVCRMPIKRSFHCIFLMRRTGPCLR